MTVNINMSFNIPSSDGGSTVAAKPRESGESGSFAALMNRSLKAEPDAGRRMKPSAGTQDDFAFASMNTQSPRQETTVSSSTPSDPSSGSSQMSDRDPSEQVQVLSEDRQDAAIAVIEDVSEGIKENLIDELDIDEEELTEVMETLGLAYMDLLNPQVLEEVITSVEEAIPELEPDAAVTDIVAELIPQNEELLQESLSENGVSMEEFAAFLDQVEEGEIELPGELEALLPQTEPEANNPILKELSTMQDQAPVLQNSNPEATAGEPVVSVTERVTVIKISDEEFGEPEISITETRTVAVPEEVQEIEDAVLPEAVQALEPAALGDEITTAEPQG
ncbi:MAG: hypothetical protein IJV04_10505 [Lachnospiraceae bacterium]|nr:hypothetical protein [Lachnospiraceae bacterium]